MDILLGLRRAAQNFGDHMAVIDGDTRFAWRDVARRVRRLSHGLRLLGIQPGERIAILMLNSYRYLELYYAVPRIGALVVPLNYRLAEPELAAILDDSGASVLVVDDSSALTGQHLAERGRVRLIYAGSGAAPVGVLSHEDLIGNGSPEDPDPNPPLPDDALVGLFYTGGTTGRAKGVMLSHKNLATNALHVTIEFLYTSDTNYLHVTPMFHLADMASTFAVTMLGGCHTLLDSFSPRAVLETMQRARVTHATLVPTMVNALIQAPELGDYDLSSWRQLLYGAAPMPVALLKRAMELFPCEFIQAYGMTEAPRRSHASPRKITDAGSRSPARYGSIGSPAPVNPTSEWTCASWTRTAERWRQARWARLSRAGQISCRAIGTRPRSQLTGCEMDGYTPAISRWLMRATTFTSSTGKRT